MSDLICYQFSRDRVEAGDAKDFLSRFSKHRVPVGKQLRAMMNSLALMIEGYDTERPVFRANEYSRRVISGK